MYGWSKIEATGSTASSLNFKTLQEFNASFQNGTPPPGAAILKYSETPTNLTFYFTPNIADYGKSIGAVPCDKPARHGLVLHVGQLSCWAMYFQD